MNQFIWKIAYIAISLGVTFWILGQIVGFRALDNLLLAIGIVIANVPEVLISTRTICLTIAAKRMLKNNIMVKNIQSFKTLGSITCICSDKTGTLLQVRMSVVHLWYDNEIKKVSDFQEDITIDNNKVIMEHFIINPNIFLYEIRWFMWF